MKHRTKSIIRLLHKPFAGSAQKGMTLIEIMIVVALLGTLMTILVKSLSSTQESAMKDATKLAMQQLGQSLEMYKVHHYKYPTSDIGLDALVKEPSGDKHWHGPYTDAKKLNDPWGTKFEYESDGRTIKIKSAGPNQTMGDSDDVVFPDEDEAAPGEASSGG